MNCNGCGRFMVVTCADVDQRESTFTYECDNCAREQSITLPNSDRRDYFASLAEVGRRPVRCGACGGLGRQMLVGIPVPWSCSACGGKGEVRP
jgi:hypothetical protein